MNRIFRSAAFYIVVALVVLVVASSLLKGSGNTEKLSLSEFEALVKDGNVATAVIHDKDDEVKGELRESGRKYKVSYPAEYADELTSELRQQGNVKLTVDRQKDSVWLSLLFNFLPFLLLIGVFVFVMNSMQGGGNRVMQFGKAKPKTMSKDQPRVTFADVAGSEEAVEELQEIKEFLENPSRFQAMGAKIPKGVLLFGPPGTGKTLLARAVAGEAGVPFFSISGSDFVEMFVGVGASRVRDLFEQAKNAAPAIIFMDEIDAVGRHRGAGLGGGHDEREQTLNQLLVEMDGFDGKTGVILIAATNRPDILDPALLRPGRFDRQIVVDRPALEGRRAILNVHAKGKPLAKEIDLDVIARRTPGFTGADLANLMNEAALLAARGNAKEISMVHLDEGIDRVIAGPERRTLVMSEDDKRRTAFHEGGHALVGHVLPDADPVHKVSIMPRGRALGLTWSIPEQDKFSATRSELRAQLAVLMGGRTAEELVFGEPTTGAANDIERATEIARAMVTQYGMSDTLGPLQLGQQAGEVFLGRDFGHQANYSNDVAARIDEEIRGLVEAAHQVARDILTVHREVLDRMASELVEHETLDTEHLGRIMGHLAKWPGTNGSAGAAKKKATTRSPRTRKAAPAT